MDLERLQVAVYNALPARLQGLALRYGTPNFTVGSLAWLTDDGTRLLLVRPSYRRGWLPVGGFLRRGETPEQTLTREVQEELGVAVELGPQHRVALDTSRLGVTFVFTGRLEPDAALRLSPELLEARWFPLSDLPPFPDDFSERFLPEDRDAIARFV